MKNKLKTWLSPAAFLFLVTVLFLLDHFLRWGLPTILLYFTFLQGVVWYIQIALLYSKQKNLSADVEKLTSKWIEPNADKRDDLLDCGYRFLRRICPGNDIYYTNYQFFCQNGGDETLFLKLLKNDLQGTGWLKPLAIIGGFPDINDWEQLSLESRTNILNDRYLRPILENH